jgi:predicted O-methyltransferase YrrM
MLNSVHFIRYLAGLTQPITETTAAERGCLRRHATGKTRLAEIGVFHGANTRAFREAMAPSGVLLAIDPFPRSFFGIRGLGWARKIAHRELSESANGTVVWVEKFGAVAPEEETVQRHLPVDFLFIDGDHSWEGIAGDWTAWRSHITPGGVVCLHDSRKRDGCGSERYTSEVIVKDPEFEVVETVDSLTVLRRK